MTACDDVLREALAREVAGRLRGQTPRRATIRSARSRSLSSASSASSTASSSTSARSSSCRIARLPQPRSASTVHGLPRSGGRRRAPFAAASRAPLDAHCSTNPRLLEVARRLVRRSGRDDADSPSAASTAALGPASVGGSALDGNRLFGLHLDLDLDARLRPYGFGSAGDGSRRAEMTCSSGASAWMRGEDLLDEIRVLGEEARRVLPALAEPLVAEAEVRARLLDDLLLEADVEDRPLPGDARRRR